MTNKTKLMMIFSLISAATMLQSANNLIINGDFEENDKTSLPANWLLKTINTSGDFLIDNIIKFKGKHSLKTLNNNTKGWCRVQQFLKIKPKGYYAFSGWVKGDSKLIVRLTAYQSDATNYKQFSASKSKLITKEWTLHYGFLQEQSWVNINKNIIIPDESSWLQVDLINNGKGLAWFDNIEIIGEEMKQEIIIKPYDTIDNTCWQKAGKFMKLGGGKTISDTSAWIKADKSFLYIKVAAQDPREKTELLKRNSDVQKDAIYWKDTLEIFISPENNTKSYYHFSVNPCGVKSAEKKKDMLGFIHAWYDSTKKIFKFDADWDANIEFINKGWIVCFKIPFNLLKMPKSGDIWKIAFCRSSTMPREYSSWPKLTKSFHEPQNFAELIFNYKNKKSIINNEDIVKYCTGGKQIAPVFIPSSKSCSQNGSTSSKPSIIPMPQKINWDGNIKVLENINLKFSNDCNNLAQSLKKWLSSYNKNIYTNFLLKDTKTFDISLELTTHEPKVLTGKDLNSYKQSEESYSITFDQNIVSLKSQTLKGLYYALETLKQLIFIKNNKCYIHVTDVYDWPIFRLRGMHFCLKVISKEHLLEMIKILSSLKMNTIFLENCEAFSYQHHPECTAKTYFNNYSASDIREIISVAKKHFIKIIPGQATFTHCKWMLKNHPELREGATGSSNYCPSNPKTYELTFSLMNELLDAYTPNSMLICHDEAQAGEIGVCEKCSKKAPHQLYGEDIIKIHNFLDTKNIGTMMFGDQLSEQNGGPPFYNKKALDLLPKDITIIDWHYGEEKKYPTSKNFIDKGFNVIGMAWEKPLNIYNYSSYLTQIGASGFSGSVWWGSWDMRQWVAYILCAEYAWSPEKPILANIAYNPMDEYLNRKDPNRKISETNNYYLFDITPACNTITEDSIGKELLGYGKSFDFRSIPKGVNTYNKIPFNIDHNKNNCMILGGKIHNGSLKYPKESPIIQIGEKLKGLAFLHSCDKPKKKIHSKVKEKIAKVIIEYDDGTQNDKLFHYRIEVVDWNAPHHTPEAFLAWEGKTKEGARIMLTNYIWKNPYPEKTIKNIRIKSASDEIPYILLSLTGLAEHVQKQ